MKATTGKKRILLNHDLCRIVEENGTVTLLMKMADGRWAVQAPYENNLRGQIGALTLALDVLAGKIMLGTTTTLDERDFDDTKLKAIEAGPKILDVKAN